MEVGAFRSTFETRDVDQLVELLEPVAPGVCIAPTGGRRFGSRCDFVRLPRAGLFTISIGESRVVQSPPRGYYSVTIARGGGFEAFEGPHGSRYEPGVSHVLDLEKSLDVRSHSGTVFLVANLDAALVEPHVRAWEADGIQKTAGQELRTDVGEGAHFAALLLELLSLGAAEAARLSPMAALETEDRLAASLVRAWLGSSSEAPMDSAEGPHPTWLARAEDYLAAKVAESVSLAQVAEAAGISARSLLRGFRSRHGVSPMRFLRLRRLEAIHRDLLEADPEATTVTDAALRHGFTHLGRFSAEFRRHFGEYPSATLARSGRASRSAFAWPALGARPTPRSQ